MKTKAKVIDHSITPELDIRDLFGTRPENSPIGWWKWQWFLICELLFGEELIENLIFTRAAQDQPLTLNRLIPRGFIIDRFRDSLLQVLYFKFYEKYCMISSQNPPRGTQEGELVLLEATSARFFLRSGISHQIIYFRRVYRLLFLLINSLVHLTLYFLSHRPELTLASFTIIQFIRGIKV